jgi:purine-nucleoside/S-methyl-5'-thioadenosine phosphorylase / adenosine deaminase
MALEYSEFEIFKKFPEIFSGIFTRNGGVSQGPYSSLNVSYKCDDPNENVDRNRELICEEIGIDRNQLITVSQVHGKEILEVDERLNKRSEEDLNEEFGEEFLMRDVKEYDGMITAKQGLYLMVQVGDCQALMMYDPVKKIIAGVHSGWKGSAQNIIGEAIKKMISKGSNPRDIHVGISPSLGTCCSEFSDPKNELPGDLREYILPNKHVDFWKMSFDQCRQAGVPEAQIALPTKCTVCNANKYFSYRAGKKFAGDFGVVIGMK